jgi:hypothetical protein
VNRACEHVVDPDPTDEPNVCADARGGFVSVGGIEAEGAIVLAIGFEG